MIVDVKCDDGSTQIARTVLENQDSYIVNFLEKSKLDLYKFMDEPEEIPKESITGFYDVENLEDTELYAKVSDGYILIDDSEDEDYEESEESDTDEDVSLIDESLIEDEET